MSRPLRVLQVIASMSPRHGGPTDAIVQIHPHLERNGIQALFASTHDDLESTLPVPEGREVDFLGAPGIFFPNTFRRPRRLRDFAISPQLLVWLKQNVGHFDVVHVHALFSIVTWRAMAIAHAAGVPFISRPLGVLGQWGLGQGGWHKRAFLRVFERRLLNKAAAIEYNSGLERDEAAALHLTAPGWIIPLGFVPVQPVLGARAAFCQRHGLDASRLLVLFLSRLHVKKGLVHLLEACAALPTDSFHLVIAGAAQTEDELTALKARAQKLGLSSSVMWAGFLQGHEKNLALRAADVFALPSHSESFGIAVAEAMSAECAIITTPAVPLADMVRQHDAGWIVPPSPGPLAAALKEALADRSRILQKGRNAAAAALATLSYEAVAPRLAALYHKAAQQRSRRR